MAPKNGPPQAKQDLVLQYFHKSGTAHTIKELEKVLPSVASINGMQVKDYLQALTDENKIRVEKIGSGNWYWSFLSEEANVRQTNLRALEEEKTALSSTMATQQNKLNLMLAAQARETNDPADRAALLEEKEGLEKAVRGLEKELSDFESAGPAHVAQQKAQIKQHRQRAELWTDNLSILESHLRNMLGGSRDALEPILQSVYGDEYVPGEGLRELSWELLQ